MNLLLPRLSRFVTVMLGVIGMLFSATNASAQDNPVIGTLTFKAGCSVTVNGKPVASGSKVRAGDVVKTSPSCKAQIKLADGGTLAINANSKVRVYFEGTSVVAAVLIGGVNYIPARTPGGNEVPVVVQNIGGDDPNPLPYLQALGFGNFPAGGNSSSSGNIVSVVLPNGRISYYDSMGRFIRYN